ncbi:MAG: dockerin type I repeat-containing protein [Clostridia bacterium]|nr:dockerin type I repeat-containing protein [Clostridia bacterium]
MKIGDVNNDGQINSSDALLILQYSVGSYALNGNAFTAADTNRDGKVNSSDALIILQFAVGKINKI